MDETMQFQFDVDRSQVVRQIMSEVYQALKEKGYDPVSQIVGYICLLYTSALRRSLAAASRRRISPSLRIALPISSTGATRPSSPSRPRWRSCASASPCTPRISSPNGVSTRRVRPAPLGSRTAASAVRDPFFLRALYGEGGCGQPRLAAGRICVRPAPATPHHPAQLCAPQSSNR